MSVMLYLCICGFVSIRKIAPLFFCFFLSAQGFLDVEVALFFPQPLYLSVTVFKISLFTFVMLCCKFVLKWTITDFAGRLLVHRSLRIVIWSYFIARRVSPV